MGFRNVAGGCWAAANKGTQQFSEEFWCFRRWAARGCSAFAGCVLHSRRLLHGHQKLQHEQTLDPQFYFGFVVEIAMPSLSNASVDRVIRLNGIGAFLDDGIGCLPLGQHFVLPWPLLPREPKNSQIKEYSLNQYKGPH